MSSPTSLGVRRAARGFTLVELMVALSGGLFLSIAVFALARDSSRFYQREARVGNATLASISGFDRLRADIARAGFLVTPNIQTDPHVCNRPPAGGAGWPELLANLRSVVIENGADEAEGGRATDRITLAGSYTSTDEFEVRTVTPAGGATRIVLNPFTGAMRRIGYDPAAPEAARVAQLRAVFLLANGAGRAVRVVDEKGAEHYGVVGQIPTGETEPVVLLAASPAPVFVTQQSRFCGFSGDGGGSLLSVVNFIRYRVRSLSDEAGYAPLFEAANPSAPNENTRTELVRSELDPAGVEVPGTAELVAEYAVDLQFNILTANSATNPAVAFGNLATQATQTSATTQLIRAVQARLSVRSREADRQGDVAADAKSTADQLFRVQLADGWARARTVQSNVAIRNHEGRLF